TKGESVGYFDITTYDAALTAQHSVGLKQLDSHQQLAADADKNGQIQTFDAALIARHSVGLDPLPGTHVSEWMFQPETKSLSNIVYDRADENFTGIIIGNVHGGWAELLMHKRIACVNSSSNKTIKRIETEKNIVLFFTVSKNQDVISMNAIIEFDNEGLEFEVLEKTPVSNNFKVLKNIEAGRLNIGMYSVMPANQTGELLRIVFRKNKNVLKNDLLQVKKLIINNEIYINKTNTYEKKNLKNEIQNFQLYQNYPNPFNSTTTISYNVLKEGFGQVTIYNIFGQEIRTLANEYFSTGYYETTWDGKDEKGDIVTSGIYFYQLKIDNFKTIKKFLLIE
ncbi:T9SS type A sorting domain-containing protein, partial [candidate division KSB1 bacterium]|nr:T9SS type A sorting domain-containing protein [candidate division KSB1 bacterium]